MPIYSGKDLLDLVKVQKSVLVYGPPITGKTYSLWTLVRYLKQQNLGKLHLFDFDGKCESLVKKLEKEGLLDRLLVYKYTEPDKVQTEARNVSYSKDRFLAFQKDFNTYWDNVDPKTGSWKESYKEACSDFPGAIFGDSLTKYQDIVKEYVVAMLGRDIGSAGTDARADYGKIMEKLKETIQSFKSLPCISGWLAHDSTERDELIGKIIVQPNVIGKKLPSELAREFNCVLYSCTQPGASGAKAEFKWQVSPGNWVISAGITSRDDLPQFVNQDYGELFK